MRLFYLLPLILASLSVIAQAEPVPEGFKSFVTSTLAEINEAVASNSYLMTDFGVSNPLELNKARLDVEKAFAMHRIALERSPDTMSIAALIEKTQYYYVPYCIDTSCPGLAAFSFSMPSNKGEFVSIGEALLSKALAETEAKRRERGIDENAQLVFVSGLQVPMLFYRDPGDGQDRLMIGTEHDAREAARLVRGNANLSPADRETAKLDILDAEHFAIYARELSASAKNPVPKEIAQAESQSIAEVIEAENNADAINPILPVTPTPAQPVNAYDTPLNSQPPTSNTTWVVLIFAVVCGLMVIGWSVFRRQ